jgi:hypothetical protein
MLQELWKDYLMELMECKTKLIITHGRLTHVDRFRWVALQLSALDTCNSPDEVTEQLQSLPQDLDESYKEFFGRLSAHHHAIVLTIMQWLAFSKTSLLVDQICEVVAIVKGEGNLQPRYYPGKKWNRHAVEAACADLVTVTNGNKFLNIDTKKKI